MSNGFEFKYKSEICKVPTDKPKQADMFHNPVAEALKDDSNVNLKVVQVEPTDNLSRLLNQAIYYVANDNPKAARKCLLATNELQDNHITSSFEAKCWVKEEAAIQRRHPAERAKFNGKPMPSEFKLVKEFWETA